MQRAYKFLIKNQTVIIKGVIAVCILSVLYALFILFLFAVTPSSKSIMGGTSKDQPTVVYDRNKKELFRFRKTKQNLTFNQLKKAELVKTLTKIEDKRFFKHEGIDYWALVRASAGLIIPGYTGGGSTITQQLCKFQYTGAASRKTFKRIWQKMKEMVIAAKVENKYSKQDILAAYLNEFDFSYKSIGISSAAKTYYNKRWHQLSPIEACGLIAMLKNPNYYNPRRSPRSKKRWLQKTKSYFEYVYGKKPTELPRVSISKLSFTDSKYSQIKLKIKRDFAETDYPDLSKSTGLKITSTLDARIQKITSRLAKKHFMGLPAEVMGGAVVIDRNKSEVLGYFAGINKRFDWISVVERPIASTIKPIIYAMALDKGIINNCTPFVDRPIRLKNDVAEEFGEWTVKNYRQFTHNTYPYHKALYKSLNNAFVNIINLDAGIEIMQKLTSAAKLNDHQGKENPTYYIGNFDLNLLELASLYMIFSAETPGYIKPTNFYNEIENRLKTPSKNPDKSFSTELIKNKNHISSTLNALCLSNNMFGKTGTSDKNADALFTGISGKYLVLVRVGSVKGNINVGAGSKVAKPLGLKILRALSPYKSSTCSQNRFSCE